MSTKVTFITVSDISGSSGHNVATKEIVRAFCDNEDIDLRLILPKPQNDSVSHIISRAQQTYFLPEKSGNRYLWHVTVQPFLFKKILQCRNSDVIISRVAPSMLPPALVTRFIDVRYVLLVRGISTWGTNQSGIVSHIYRSVLRSNVHSADKVVIAYSEVESEMNSLGISTSNVVTFPNAVDPDLFKPIPKQKARNLTSLEFSSGSLVVGFVGSFNERHKLFPLVESLNLCVHQGINVSGLFVGDGPQREKLYHTFDSQVQVEFTGTVPHETVPTYISACDVLYGVAPSGNPSNPIKIYEYLACERPVITSKTPELSFIDSIGAGILLDEVKPAKISDAIKYFAELDEEERQRMGRLGRNYVAEEHTWDKIVEICIDD